MLQAQLDVEMSEAGSWEVHCCSSATRSHRSTPPRRGPGNLTSTPRHPLPRMQGVGSRGMPRWSGRTFGQLCAAGYWKLVLHCCNHFVCYIWASSYWRDIMKPPISTPFYYCILSPVLNTPAAANSGWQAQCTIASSKSHPSSRRPHTNIGSV